MRKINVTRSSMPDLNEYINEISELWESHWLTNMGIKHNELEIKLCDYLQIPKVTLFTNGHLALESIISVLKLKGEIITTPFTFVSTTHAIVRNGIIPVFCDINPIDYTIDVSKIESLISDKTSAIIPVHVYGNICNVEELDRISKKYNIPVIYDSAHAFGVKYKGKNITNYGYANMFSFHATKVFNTIEGGAITYSDLKLEKMLNDTKNFGITGLETVDYIGTNAKMNEFQASMGICNLRHVDNEILKRKKVYEKYISRLANIKGIKISNIQENVLSNYSYFPVIFDNFKYTRDEVFDILARNNIYSRKYFYPLTSSFECYRNNFDVGCTPVALDISQKVLTLPLYADLELETVDAICDIIIGKGDLL